MSQRILMIHPRVEDSFRFHPSMPIWAVQRDYESGRFDGTEALAQLPTEGYIDYVQTTVLEFLLQYDWRGSNEFQEQENLEFLRMYVDRYPAIRHHFDIHV